MNKMKLIMESWRSHIREEEPPSELSPEQKKALSAFLQNLVALSTAAEDSQPVEERRAGGAQRRRRRKRHQIRRYKERAGIPTDVKIKNFTPEQRELYDAAKQQFKTEDEAEIHDLLYDLSHGDLLKIPLVKQLIDASPDVLRTALAMLTMDPDCAEKREVTLTCLTNAISGQATMG